jgi:hypothetical protein
MATKKPPDYYSRVYRAAAKLLGERPQMPGQIAYDLAILIVDNQLEQCTLPFDELKRQLAAL